MKCGIEFLKSVIEKAEGDDEQPNDWIANRGIAFIASDLLGVDAENARLRKALTHVLVEFSEAAYRLNFMATQPNSLPEDWKRVMASFASDVQRWRAETTAFMEEPRLDHSIKDSEAA